MRKIVKFSLAEKIFREITSLVTSYKNVGFTKFLSNKCKSDALRTYVCEIRLFANMVKLKLKIYVHSLVTCYLTDY